MRLLLLGSFLFFSLFANAATTLSPQVKEGVAAIRAGDKTKAWGLLFPEANKGDVQAMFYLGDMMLRSPEYGDHIERSISFFSAAAARGHTGAKELLNQAQSILAKKTAGTLPSIAGVSGMPTQQELATARARFDKYKREVLQYTNGLNSDGLPVKVFLNYADLSTDRIYKLSKELETRFGKLINVQFYVVIDPAEWRPAAGTSTIPPVGFTPDFKGLIAAKYAIGKPPAVVLTPTNGKPILVKDLGKLTQHISSLL